MARPAGTGVWCREVVGWKLELKDGAGALLYRFTEADNLPDDEGKFPIGLDWKLDCLGTLSSGTLELANTLELPPFGFAVKLWVRDRVEGLEEVFEGFYENEDPQMGANGSGGLHPYTLKGFHELITRKYWHGNFSSLPPAIGRIGANETHNWGLSLPDIASAPANNTQAAGEKANLSVKVSDVMNKALEDHPDGSWGVDAERRVLCGKPSLAPNPVIVPAQEVFELSPSGYEIPPYVTEARAYPPEGWAGFETARAVPGFVPEVAQDGGQVELVEEVTASGMPIVASATLDLFGLQPVLDDAGLPTTDPITGLPALERKGPDPVPFGQLVEVRRVLRGYAACLVADPQTWFERSALIKTNLSSYEPLSAKFTLGVNVHRLPLYYSASGYGERDLYYNVVVDAAFWISESPEIDPDAVGPPDPLLFTNPSPIHIRQSGHTVFDLTEKQNRDRATKLDIERQQPIVDFKIEEKWFRQDQRPALIAEGWSGRIYLHMALTWMLEPPLTDLESNYSPPEDQPELALADVTLSLFPAQFGQKVAVAPDWGAEILGLNWPFYHGPNHEGWVEGVLITPARVQGSYRIGSSDLSAAPRTINAFVAGVDGSLRGGTARSSLTTGVLPYRTSSATYSKARRT